MTHESLTLCSECERVDLALYFCQEIHVLRDADGAVGPSQDAVLLKSLADTYTSAPTCELCRMLLAALCKKFEPQSWLESEEYLVHISKFVKDPGVYLYSYIHAEDFRPLCQGGEDEEDGRDEEMLIYQSFRLGIGLSTAMDAIPMVRLAGTLQLAESSCEALGLDPDFLGRVICAERANMQLARAWLDECLFEHASHCQRLSKGIDQPPPMPGLEDLRVIDVDRMCLCFLPHGGEYVTLSYRWASSPIHFTTTSTNIGELEAEGALRQYSHRIPQTTQDAMDCVRELGEKFLWVDALCIIQDLGDKDRLIQRMDRIYEDSLVTIIAAPPSEEYYPLADGLPGYRVGTRLFAQDSARVHGLDICTSFLSVEMALVGCPWGSRAWTFQEELLSKRRLYFTPSQLYFQCACGVFCEDVMGEGKSISAYIYALGSLGNLAGRYTEIGEGQRGAASGLSRTEFRTHWDAILYYENLVERYTRRDMTHQGDILVALKGVLTVLEESMRTQFLFGLPEAYFDEAVLWITRRSCSRRQAVSNAPHRKRFPSWAWAGWDAEACYRGHSIGGIRPEARWFLVGGDGHMAQLAVSQPQDSSSEPLECLSPSDEDPRIAPSNLIPRSRVKPEDAEVSPLACLSSIASFKFLGDTLSEQHWDWPDHKIFVISDAHDRPVGAMWMENSWSHRIENQAEFEFLLLSQSKSVEFVPELDESMFPNADWSHVNVMLVERQGDLAERLGIGVVHKNSWVAACPRAAILYLA